MLREIVYLALVACSFGAPVDSHDLEARSEKSDTSFKSTNEGEPTEIGCSSLVVLEMASANDETSEDNVSSASGILTQEQFTELKRLGNQVYEARKAFKKLAPEANYAFAKAVSSEEQKRAAQLVYRELKSRSAATDDSTIAESSQLEKFHKAGQACKSHTANAEKKADTAQILTEGLRKALGNYNDRVLELESFALKNKIPEFVVALHSEKQNGVSGLSAVATSFFLSFRRLGNAVLGRCAAVSPVEVFNEEQVTTFVTAANYRRICPIELLWSLQIYVVNKYRSELQVGQMIAVTATNQRHVEQLLVFIQCVIVEARTCHPMHPQKSSLLFELFDEPKFLIDNWHIPVFCPNILGIVKPWFLCYLLSELSRTSPNLEGR